MTRFMSTAVLVVSLSLATSARAQNAMITGTIVDPSGAVLPAVQVMAARVDPAERSTTTVVTDAHGAYEFHALLPGSYTLTASLPGFESFRAQLTLDAGDSIERNVTLQVGSIQETITVTAHDTPAPPHQAALPREPPTPAPQPLAPGAVRVGGNIKPPLKVYDVHPIYPAAPAAQGVGGTVILSATIGTDGLVRDAKALRNPNDDLSRAAIDAVSQWRFTATLLNGNPIDTRMNVVVNFDK